MTQLNNLYRISTGLVFLLILVHPMLTIQAQHFIYQVPIVNYASKINHEGDLIIEGHEVFEIKDSEYIQNGNIIVKDSATLILINSKINLNQAENEQYYIRINNYAKLIMIENSHITSQFGYRLTLKDQAIANISKSKIEPPYLEIFSSSRLYVRDSIIQYIGTYGNSEAIITNSVIVDSVYVTSGSVIMSNIEIYRVGLSFQKLNSDVILRELKPGFYNNWNLYKNNTIIDAYQNLTIVNTSISNWYINAWGDHVTVEAIDSYLMGAASARTSIFTVINSTIKSWIQAGGDSVLKLINSNFIGTDIQISENGRIVLGWFMDILVTSNGIPVEGSIIEAQYIHNNSLAKEVVTGPDGSIRFDLPEKILKSDATEVVNSYVVKATWHETVEENRIFLNDNKRVEFSFPPMIIIDETYVSNDRCDIGDIQRIGVHTKWAHNNSDVVNGIIYVEDEYGSFEKLSSGKIFYDTFSKAGGTETDEPWHIGFTWYDGDHFEGGTWWVEDGKYVSKREYGDPHITAPFAYPYDVTVTDFLWEADVMPMIMTAEGPEVRFIGYENGQMMMSAVYDYYSNGHVLRLMINTGRMAPHSTYLSKPFTMEEGKWYNMKMKIKDDLIKCYLNSELIFEARDDNIGLFKPGIILHCGYVENNLGYWDNVKIWKSNKINIENLYLGQKVELYDELHAVRATNILGMGEDTLELDVSDLTFPFKGYFKVYSSDGITLLYTTPVYADIWGGDEYYANHRRELITDENGWAYFEDSLYTTGMKRWDVVDVDCNGVTEYFQKISSPSIIWDRVNFRLITDETRINTGTEAPIDIRGSYEFDDVQFEGSATLNDTLIKYEVGKYGYKILEIEDPYYGLTSFTSNELGIIFDKVIVNITVLDSRIDIGLDPEIMVSAKYAYDSEGFSGKYIKIKTPKMLEVGEVAYTVESIFDPLYGLTTFSSNIETCVWDRINIFYGEVSKETSKVGDMETVWFKALYEYDGIEFTGQDGVLYVNNVPLSWSSHDGQWKYSTTLDEPGSIVFEVTGVEDNNYGLTAINDEVGPLTITWERPFWETPVGIISIGGIIVVIVSAAIFFLRKRI